ncbi:MAG: uroporphyrinogen decarboxylase family protein [Planctomycetaceae bacterium]|nr:uroporphyrinogen decarboxylase family protein [Planctomycetaceae bacterium]
MKLTSRQRIETTCRHEEPDILPVDFGGGGQTGLHVGVVYKLRQALKLDPPGTPVKVVEPYQMLGEVADDLRDYIGCDAVPLQGTGTMFGFPAIEYKKFVLPDGTPTLVPIDFNTEFEPDGSLLQYPGGDRSVPASGVMPSGGSFFDATVRVEPFDEATLVKDNTEEFVLFDDALFDHYRREAERLSKTSDRAIFCGFGGLTFGDIALVPATFLKRPKGIRDITEWYVSTATRKPFIKAVFEYQAEIAVENLKRLHQSVGDRISVIQTNGTDFGTQNGPFLSEKTYRELYLPYQKRVNGWIHQNTNWKTFMHCCGGIVPLLEAIAEAEFDILNPVQCSARGMDAKWLKKEYGNRFVFWGGGIDTQKTLPFGTPDEVRDQVKERIEIFAPGGGFVFNAIHNVLVNTPIDNILAVFEVLREYRK